MKILFIRHSFLINNPEFTGSSLVDYLINQEHLVQIKSGIVPDDEFEAYGAMFQPELVTQTELFTFDALYIEGGYPNLNLKTIEIIKDFVQAGHIFILADNDQNAISGQEEIIERASLLFGTKPSGTPNSPVLIREELSLDNSFNTRFSTELMALNGLGKELVEDIPEIAVGSPLALDSFSSEWLLTGTSLSKNLQVDRFVNEGISSAWATCNHFGLGYAVLISGKFTNPIVLDAVIGNKIWLGKLLMRLTELIFLERGSSVLASSFELPFEFLRLEESKTHEKKSSAFVPLNTGTEKVVVHALAKSIAAMCNTDGGTVVVGQADDGEIVGIANDMEFKNVFSLDQFELKLRDALQAKLQKRLQVLGVNLDFVVIGEDIVALFTCPKSAQPVYTKAIEGSDQVVYIRDGNSTQELKGPQLVEYILKRFI